MRLKRYSTILAAMWFCLCALAGNAELIVSGDRDLLSLKTFRSIPIVTPAEAVRILTAA